MKLNTQQSKIRAGELQLGDQLILNGDAWEVMHVQMTHNRQWLCARMRRDGVERYWPAQNSAAHVDDVITAIVLGFVDEAQADLFGDAA